MAGRSNSVRSRDHRNTSLPPVFVPPGLKPAVSAPNPSDSSPLARRRATNQPLRLEGAGCDRVCIEVDGSGRPSFVGAGLRPASSGRGQTTQPNSPVASPRPASSGLGGISPSVVPARESLFPKRLQAELNGLTDHHAPLRLGLPGGHAPRRIGHTCPVARRTPLNHDGVLRGG